MLPPLHGGIRCGRVTPVGDGVGVYGDGRYVPADLIRFISSTFTEDDCFVGCVRSAARSSVKQALCIDGADVYFLILRSAICAQEFRLEIAVTTPQFAGCSMALVAFVLFRNDRFRVVQVFHVSPFISFALPDTAAGAKFTVRASLPVGDYDCRSGGFGSGCCSSFKKVRSEGGIDELDELPQ